WASDDGRLAFGAAVRNLGTPVKYADAAVRVPVSSDAGVAWQAARTAYGTLTGTLDYRARRGLAAQGVIGGELALVNGLWLRAPDESLLIVDDDPQIRDLLSDLLAGPGREVRCAGSGAEARAAVADAVPAVVLLDIELGDTSGLNLLETFGALEPSPTVVMVT